ncbi:MAG: DUF1780 domain-containing protein [Pseudomonadota bacterium]
MSHDPDADDQPDPDAQPDADEEAYLVEHRKALLESVAFWSPEKKLERELWVVRTFLRHLNVQYADSELVPETSEPPDINFRSARFEIKEILDPDRRRHEEYREKLEKAGSAKRLRDLMEQYTPQDLTYEEIGDQAVKTLEGLAKHYAPKVIERLDLLLYVNLLRRVVDTQSPVPSPSRFSGFGWRSVSVVRSSVACVFHARSDAPEFLQPYVGKPTSQGIE